MVHIPKIYIDRSVISDLTLRELAKAPATVSAVLTDLPDEALIFVSLTDEVEELAARYIDDGVVQKSSVVDALHIAAASVHRADLLVSWNFRHIVHWSRIRSYNAVNLKAGYPFLDIRSPREVVHEKDV